MGDFERRFQAITEAYCEAFGIPIRPKTTEAERAQALKALAEAAPIIAKLQNGSDDPHWWAEKDCEETFAPVRVTNHDDREE